MGTNGTAMSLQSIKRTLLSEARLCGSEQVSVMTVVVWRAKVRIASGELHLNG